nr:immunoglobulin light chain junction region [Macaca mulatta]MPN91606.1 immunoglobulin light chain junction region [Macaca mulatta]MPN94591.1 immunoglobulin light chain junction region [Macaca mulatta]MPN95928.1 immunoglobulin light chain junction region [Macaca mulatta]MPN96468.1 immunoglobulin light chain junction region [Macaca mulatta]
CQHYYSAPYRF